MYLFLVGDGNVERFFGVRANNWEVRKKYVTTEHRYSTLEYAFHYTSDGYLKKPDIVRKHRIGHCRRWEIGTGKLVVTQS